MAPPRRCCCPPCSWDFFRLPPAPELPGCHAPHKVAHFELPAATPLTLQFSAGDAATVRVAVLRAPPAHDKM